MLLPALAHDIPHVLRPPQHMRTAAQVACLLADAGVLHRRDLNGEDDEPLPVAARALNRWLRNAVGRDLEVLGCNFTMEVLQYETLPFDIRVSWYAEWHGDCYLGPPLEALETAVSGLGASVLDLLGTQQVSPMFTPRSAFQHLRYGAWLGHRSEAAAMKERFTDANERAEVMQQIVRRSMFDEALPAWTLKSLTKRKLSTLRLKRVAERTDWCGAVASNLLMTETAVRLAAESARGIEDMLVPDDNALHTGWDSVFTGHAACFRWNATDDITQRVYDDMVTEGMETGTHDHLGIVDFGIDQPDDLRRFLRAMRAHCRAVGMLDRLMVLLHERQ